MPTYTPVQLARLLGYIDESRPGLVVRNYLRSKYPEHEKNARWELDEAQAADVVANVPRRDQVRGPIHPWLEVPWDRVEPIGALAIASGRIEAAAAMTLRALLRPLDRGTARALASTPSFSATTRLVSTIMKSSVIAEVDGDLLSDWTAWAARAEKFMKKRNGVLHGIWSMSVDDTGGPGVLSTSRNTFLPAPSGGHLTMDAMMGMQIAREGYFAGRIAVAIASDAYDAARVSSGDKNGWITF